MKKSRYLIVLLILASLMINKVLFSQGTWKHYTKDDGLKSNAVNYILEDKHKNIWCKTHMRGVMKFDGNKWINYTKKDGLTSNMVTTMFEDSKGNIWLRVAVTGRGNGVMKFNGTSFELIAKNVMASHIYEDSRGVIWFGNFMVCSYDGKNLKKYTKKNAGLPGNGISSFFQDSTGNIWIGTSEGVAKFKVLL